MNNYCIYMHLNKINNKTYIGLTSQNPQRRWRNGQHYKTCLHFDRAIQKYGWDNFEHIIFQDNLSYEEANYMERLLIRLFNTNDYQYGYNIQAGGHHGKHADSSKEKIRAKALGRIMSNETKEKISQRMQGAKNPRARRVRCLNNGMVFNTAKEAAIWCNRDNSGLSKCAKGKAQYCGFDIQTGEKLKWEYIN